MVNYPFYVFITRDERKNLASDWSDIVYVLEIGATLCRPSVKIAEDTNIQTIINLSSNKFETPLDIKEWSHTRKTNNRNNGVAPVYTISTGWKTLGKL